MKISTYTATYKYIPIGLPATVYKYYIVNFSSSKIVCWFFLVVQPLNDCNNSDQHHQELIFSSKLFIFFNCIPSIFLQNPLYLVRALLYYKLSLLQINKFQISELFFPLLIFLRSEVRLTKSGSTARRAENNCFNLLGQLTIVNFNWSLA